MIPSTSRGDNGMKRFTKWADREFGLGERVIATLLAGVVFVLLIPFVILKGSAGRSSDGCSLCGRSSINSRVAGARRFRLWRRRHCLSPGHSPTAETR